MTHIQINIVFLKDKGSFQIMLSLYLERKDFISFVFYRNSYLIKEDLLKELVSHAVMLFWNPKKKWIKKKTNKQSLSILMLCLIFLEISQSFICLLDFSAEKDKLFLLELIFLVSCVYSEVDVNKHKKITKIHCS